ncbi:MAG TPA: hypothetical protein VFW44_09055 [Bryobacteraceae bacterium]|nr:hypothetical protein [Bryobacteraceae bacterium]
MSKQRLLAAVQSGVLGLAALIALLWIEQALMRGVAPFLGPSWLPTARVFLECGTLAVAGWFVGRWDRLGVWLVAAIIAIPNLSHVPGIDVAWLIRLLLDSFRDSRYVASFFNFLGVHILMFASLFIGARLSRPRERTSLRIQ